MDSMPCYFVGLRGHVALFRTTTTTTCPIHMKIFLVSLALSAASLNAAAGQTADVVCSYAPSQSRGVAALSAAAGGSAAAASAVAVATGTAAVAHSSGALILTGSGGYIAGTLGTAVVGPTIVVVGLVVGGAAISVELLCAPKNHPGQVAKVKEAATEFARRTRRIVSITTVAIPPKVVSGSLSVKKRAGEAVAYAFARPKAK